MLDKGFKFLNTADVTNKEDDANKSASEYQDETLEIDEIAQAKKMGLVTEIKGNIGSFLKKSAFVVPVVD